MTAEINHSLPTQRPRYLYPGFIASLALNLLFIGLAAAAIWHHDHEAPKPRDNGFLGFVDKLSPERRDVIKQKILAARLSMKNLRDDMRKSWIDANQLLTAEPFDKDKFLAALMQLRSSEDAFKSAIYKSVAETAQDLTPEERKLLQAWREQRHSRLLKPQPEPGDGDSKPN
ncbi:MAG: periplasmic heavy metal sensor [Hyphomicrobium sp.]|uniref:periplasmic heavy metal sensor n=1 Tax=Hyphomicrobium sp. TaxID=82 RepID=UPI0039E31AE2